MAALTEAHVHEVLRRDLGGSGWQVSNPLGSMGTTRLARRGTIAVSIKLVSTPLSIMTRLSEIGVAPPVFAAGEHQDSQYVVQQAVTGPHPDHDWFDANVARWADMVRRYVDDVPLRRMLGRVPGCWRLSVAEATARFDDPPAPRSAALQETTFRTSFRRWRSQADDVVGLPLRPVHPDPHWNNYVIAAGQPYLLDWEHIDLSDPLRDVGVQTWSFLRKRRWAEFLVGVGVAATDDVEVAVYWWAAFKMLMNAYWNDSQGDEQGASLHARLFQIATERRPWVDQCD